jgi:2'-5' RNA ligase
VRLFLAFELPAELRARIGERVESLRSALPAASWVSAERMHLTLVFLGEVEESTIAALGGALRPIFAAAPRLVLRLTGPGTFPPHRPARVAWLGVAGAPAPKGPPTAASEEVLAAIERSARLTLAPLLDRALEDRPYHAHVTLARPRRPWGRGAVERFRAACSDLVGEWEAARVVLMESRPGRDGARYSVCHDYALGSAAA